MEKCLGTLDRSNDFVQTVYGITNPPPHNKNLNEPLPCVGKFNNRFCSHSFDRMYPTKKVKSNSFNKKDIIFGFFLNGREIKRGTLSKNELFWGIKKNYYCHYCSRGGGGCKALMSLP